jgi:hypothetical protein
VAGARWVQSEILEEHPKTNIKVYAVSFRMLASDRFAKSMVEPEDLLSDPRVVHFWDEGKIVGRWYEENVTHIGQPGDERVEWDAYFLYAPETAWDEEPPSHVSWGRTIVGTRERLRKDLADVLASWDSESKN